MIAGLRSMARADESPHERDIARAKLAEAGVPIDPPRPPAPAASPSPDPWNWSVTTSTSSGATWSMSGTAWVVFR